MCAAIRDFTSDGSWSIDVPEDGRWPLTEAISADVHGHVSHLYLIAFRSQMQRTTKLRQETRSTTLTMRSWCMSKQNAAKLRLHRLCHPARNFACGQLRQSQSHRQPDLEMRSSRDDLQNNAPFRDSPFIPRLLWPWHSRPRNLVGVCIKTTVDTSPGRREGRPVVISDCREVTTSRAPYLRFGQRTIRHQT